MCASIGGCLFQDERLWRLRVDCYHLEVDPARTTIRQGNFHWLMRKEQAAHRPFNDEVDAEGRERPNHQGASVGNGIVRGEVLVLCECGECPRWPRRLEQRPLRE